MSDREKLAMAEALGAFKQIATCTDPYVARALAMAAVWSIGYILETGEVPSDEQVKAFLRSQGIQSGVTRAGGN